MATKSKNSPENEQVLALVKEKGVKIVDYKFTDLLGQWQHFSSTIGELEDALEDGIGFDGSSIRGFRSP